MPKNLSKIETIMVSYEPVILLCLESRITEQFAKNEYAIESYNTIECFSETRSTGGALIYLKKDIKYKIILNKFFDKMLWFLAIEIWNSKIDGIYAVFYRSPNKDVNVESALNALDESFDNTINLNKLNVISGDLNIDLNKKTNKYAKIAKTILTKHTRS